MTDPKAQVATQIRNIEESTGTTMAQFTALIRKTGLEKHGKIVSHLKTEHGMTHGNANLVAHLVREELVGGPPPDDDLLEAQYSGKKAELRPLYEELATFAAGLGPDVEQVIQKTGVSFRRRKQFALVQAPSAKRIQLGLNLPDTPKDGRVKAVSGMCSHRVDITGAAEIDDAVTGWIRASYDAAG